MEHRKPTWEQINVPLTGQELEDYDEQLKIYKEQILNLVHWDLSTMSLEALQEFYIDWAVYMYDVNTAYFETGKQYKYAFNDPEQEWWFLPEDSIEEGHEDKGWYFDVRK